MPLTVTASNGDTYHVWQLPELSAPEPEDITRLTTLDNDLADGYRSSALFGVNTGVREWNLKMPTLAHTEVGVPTVTGPNGETLSREQYVRETYLYNKVSGTPIAYQDKNSGQYYLVDFADDELSMQRMRVKLFSTGLRLHQRRIPGVTIFSAGDSPYIWAAYKGESFPTTFPGPVGDVWADETAPDDIGNTHHLLTTSTDVVAATVNSHGVVRFSNTTNNGYLYAAATPTVKEIICLMKMRESSFSNNAGIVTADATEYALIGDTGTTKFFNHSLGSALTYKLNGTTYAESNMQAPMNTWGIVHWRYTTGLALANLQVGKDRNFAGRFAEVDINYLVIATGLIPEMTFREIYEAMTIRRNNLNA